MGVEIERKFLVNTKKWHSLQKPKSEYLRQGYLSDDIDCTVRVREMGGGGFLTVKGRTEGTARAEYEYPIPKADAKQMLDTLAKTQLAKTRYKIIVDGHTWDVDVFHDANEGLILAEIELQNAHDTVELPHWLEQEVSDDPKYFNSSLAKNIPRNTQS